MEGSCTDVAIAYTSMNMVLELAAQVIVSEDELCEPH
jgi:hypothetical protein